MNQLPALIHDLGYILIVAAVVTLVFRRFGQPVILGYLIAGILVGPHMPWIPAVQDKESLEAWAEIGVIILLFGLGLEFSFRKLASIGRVAIITGLFEVLLMLGVGYFLGRSLGWQPIESLFLGGVLCISSTAVIVRTFDELGLRGRRFVSLVYGVLVVEDLLAITLMALFTTLSVTQSLEGTALFREVGQLAFALVIWFVLGMTLVPSLLNRIRNDLTSETTLVIALGSCLTMVIVSTKLGFSPALGAFMTGSLLAATRDGEKVERLIHPIRDLFAAIFFVSVGMLIDPHVVIERGGQILTIAAVLVAGKFVFISTGSLIAGASPKHSFQAGLSMGQIGEFSFVFAALGTQLKVTGSQLYPMAVAISAVTTFTTPYLIKNADTIFAWFNQRVPRWIIQRFERYRQGIQAEAGHSGIMKLIWASYGWKLVVNSALSVFVFAVAEGWLRPLLLELTGSFSISRILATLSACALTLPFLSAIAFGLPSTRLTQLEYERLERINLGLSIARGFFTAGLAATLLGKLTPLESWFGVLVFTLWLSLVALGRFSESIYGRMEKRFLRNLQGRSASRDTGPQSIPRLAPWDVGLVDITVNPNSKLVGQSLLQASLRERFGITIASVQRGKLRQFAPDRDWVLMPGDRLAVIGSDEQVVRAQQELEHATASLPEFIPQNLVLSPHRLLAGSPWIGKTLRECGIRESIDGLVVGIERGTERLLSPDSNLYLREGDLLWLAGDVGKIRELQSSTPS